MTRRALVGCEMSGEVRDALAATGAWDEVWSADILPTETPTMTFVAAESRWENVPSRPEGGGPRVRHYQGDVRDLFDPEHPVNRVRFIDLQCNYIAPERNLWDLAILHPPCDHLASAGARYWKEKQQPRYDEDFNEIWSVQAEAAAFFMQMVNAPAPLVAVENPRGIMGRKREPLYRVPDQVVEPWWFGDPLAKKTCLWLKGLPLLTADRPVEPTGRVATGGGSHRTDTRNGRTAMNRVHEDRRGRKFRKVERSRTLPGFARAMAEQWTAFVEAREAA